jgi:hypothetical protein
MEAADSSQYYRLDDGTFNNTVRVTVAAVIASNLHP